MTISIIDCPCCSSILNAQIDFFYRFNEKISRSVAIGLSELLGGFMRILKYFISCLKDADSKIIVILCLAVILSVLQTVNLVLALRNTG